MNIIDKRIVHIPMNKRDIVPTLELIDAIEGEVVEKIVLYDTTTGKELGYALLSTYGTYDAEFIFNKYFQGLRDYSKEEFYDLWEEYQQTLNNINYLHYIEVAEEGKGYASIILDEIGYNFGDVWIYSAISAESFWEYVGFEEIGEQDHVWMSNWDK